ncbi:DEAD/DEAH box helicase [Helicovermis profundi]|uniref:DEAD/DEAH box helicase n=2 Tax=Helicovermis profundi TaxID=3065157 RepID=A0AAU9E3P4_9FIRM|nr:DEAD/DEAH box helicase [Clostridia bacterium S502]
MSFYKLGVNGDWVYALECQNIITPTPIQTLSIPPILKGKDLIGEAQTGTGKTYAFLLPMFQKIDPSIDHIQGLIIVPTRELALQITEVATILSKYNDINILAAYGGQDIKAQLHKLNGNVHLVIGTPGRILDHLRRETINFDNLKIFVVDEADQMFHIGFKKEVDEIIKNLPSKRQTLCFSATISSSVSKFANKYLNNPISVTAPKKQIILDNLAQFVLETSNRQKYNDFLRIIKETHPTKSIVFCRSRRGSEALFEEMKLSGFKVERLHGGLTQGKREIVMNGFRNNQFDFLIATDVASRGIDVENISHVFNYNLPDDIENYVHRVGRCARKGNTGVTYTILTLKDEKRLEEIEKFIKMKIKRISFSSDREKNNAASINTKKIISKANDSNKKNSTKPINNGANKKKTNYSKYKKSKNSK